MNVANILLGMMLAGLLSLLALTVINAFSLPLVHMSHSSGECVLVEGPGSCEQMPEKYTVVWVK
ncbi:MAG: hypothetical protein LC687_04680 [Actinobacteria bacterium]|nr:hypothetical protein [Actinomycetota bacterium]MCA1807129.1 hypothetical protein [Actinomycetota bacterium]